MHSKNDNVSISEFMQFLQQFVRFILNILGYSRKLLRQYFMFFLTFMVLGFATGWMMTHKDQPYYESGITCLFNDLHKKNYGEMIVLLNKYVSQKDTHQISNLLHIRNTEAQSILFVKASNIAGAALHEDLTPEKLPFYITYGTLGNEHTAAINKGLLYYLQNCNYNAVRRTIRKDNATEKIAFIDAQLHLLDSLKMGFNQYLIKGKSAQTQPADVKLENLFKESETLFKERQDAEWTLHFDNSVELMYEQMPVLITGNSSALKNGLMGLAIGLVLAFVSMGLLDLSKQKINA